MYCSNIALDWLQRSGSMSQKMMWTGGLPSGKGCCYSLLINQYLVNQLFKTSLCLHNEHAAVCIKWKLL